MSHPLPRFIAAAAFLLGLIGMTISLPLLSSFETSFYFLLGASVWGFFLWRTFGRQFREEYLIGWIWSAILHLAFLPVSGLIGGLAEGQLPVPSMILVMFVLSIVGLFSDLMLGARERRR